MQVAEFQTVRQRALIPWLVLVDANCEDQLGKRVIAEPLIRSRAQSSFASAIVAFVAALTTAFSVAAYARQDELGMTNPEISAQALHSIRPTDGQLIPTLK